MPRSDRVSDEFFIRNMLIIPNQIQQSPRHRRWHHDPSELRGTCVGRRRRREERRSTNLIAKFFPIIVALPTHSTRRIRVQKIVSLMRHQVVEIE